MELTGSSAIVTGGASGIGAACARQLAARGATVVVADLQADKGEALAEEIKGVFAQVDVTKTVQGATPWSFDFTISPVPTGVPQRPAGTGRRDVTGQPKPLQATKARSSRSTS